MNLKPVDFHLGIRDLLTLLVPGSVLAFAFSPVYAYLFGPGRVLPEPVGGVGLIAAFLISAFIFGHLVEAVASVLLDPLYDRTYRNLVRLPPPTGEARSKPSLITRLRQAWGLTDKDSHDPLRDAARLVHVERLNKRGVATALAGAKKPSLLDWAQSSLVLHASAGATDIESLQAASKFFRSMSLVVVFVPIISLLQMLFVRSPTPPRPLVFSLASLALGIVLAVALALRFMKLRWTATQRTYEYYIEAQGPLSE